MPTTPALRRIIALDYLRGFFIAVIIIDHLYRWPSALALFTGQGWLWMTAAEGFFIISGLLSGYIRAFKNRSEPLRSVQLRQLKRAAILYAWAVGLTLIFTLLCWLAVNHDGLIPFVPIASYDWAGLLWQSITQLYSFTWIHFLTLYWIVLVLSCLSVALLRRGEWWLVAILSIMGWIGGVLASVEWLQWQILFFLPSIAGYYLEPISRYFAARPGLSRVIQNSILTATGLTLALSVFFTFIYQPPSSLHTIIAALTAREPLMPLRLVISELWFSGFLILFKRVEPFLVRRFNWLLLFGTRSLSAYIAHGFVLFAFQMIVPLSGNIWVNTLTGIGCVAGTWLLLNIPFVRRLVPT